jgi:hypothetical protein
LRSALVAPLIYIFPPKVTMLYRLKNEEEGLREKVTVFPQADV